MVMVMGDGDGGKKEDGNAALVYQGFLLGKLRPVLIGGEASQSLRMMSQNDVATKI
jgi:hypothetical protein